MWQTSRWRKQIIVSIREIVFGLEDSLVSTLGALTGIAAGAQDTYIVILSGLTLVAVEATSMAAGSYLSSKSVVAAAEATNRGKKNRDNGQSTPLRAAVVMGTFYFVGGFVPLAPYFFLPINEAYAPSIIGTALALFGLGVWSAEFTRRGRYQSGLEMAGISLGAALLGYLIGRMVSQFLGVNIL